MDDKLLPQSGYGVCLDWDDEAVVSHGNLLFQGRSYADYTGFFLLRKQISTNSAKFLFSCILLALSIISFAFPGSE